MGFDNVNVNVCGGQSIIKALQNYNTIILKPNIVDNRNVLTQEMMSERHTKYVIRWNYSLEGATINVPEDCIIEFAGGTIDNGTIVGNNTMLMYSKPIDEVCLAERQGTFIYNTTVADEEDITSASGQLKFKDRLATDGMGRKILRKNIVNGVNTLTQEMVSDANTIYIIQYDFTLGEDITIPANCVLEFDGGSIKNGTLIGNNTQIETCGGGIFKVNDADDAIHFTGTWVCPYITTDWWKSLDYNDSLEDVFSLQNAEIQNKIIIEKYSYDYVVTAEENRTYLNIIYGNLDIILNGDIKIKPNALTGYSIITVGSHSNNIRINGSGSISGDRYEHDYTPSGTHEYGFCILITEDCHNVEVSGITIKDATGDGVSVYDTTSIVNFNNLTVRNCRRCGIAIRANNNIVFDNCLFENIVPDVNAQAVAAIDVEPVPHECEIYNIYVQNCHFNGCCRGISSNAHDYYGDNERRHYKNIEITNCDFNTSTYTAFIVLAGWENAVVDGCRFYNGKQDDFRIMYVLNALIKNCHTTTDGLQVHTWHNFVNTLYNNKKVIIDSCYGDKIAYLFSDAKNITLLNSTFVIDSTDLVRTGITKNPIIKNETHDYDIDFQNNHFIGAFMFLDSSEHYTRHIKNNIFEDCVVTLRTSDIVFTENRITGNYPTIFGVDSRFAQNCIISNNEILSNRVYLYCDTSIIEGNYVSLTENTNLFVFYNITVNGSPVIAKRNILKHNMLLNLTKVVINSSDTIVSGNNIDGRVTSGDTAGVIHINGNNVVLAYNSIKNSGDGYCIHVDAGITGTIICGNSLTETTIRHMRTSSPAIVKDNFSNTNFAVNAGKQLCNYDSYDAPNNGTSEQREALDLSSAYTGLSYYDTDLKKEVVYDGNKWRESDYAIAGVARSGVFADKPSKDDIYVGFKYFCTDKQTAEGANDGIEIIHKGNNVWVDALGRVVS